MSDSELFAGKTLPDILQDIHDNTLNKRSAIQEIITRLTEFLTNKDDAALIAPMIKDFYEVSIKNDDHMVKMANIASRLQNSKNEDDSGELLSDDDKEQLLAAPKSVHAGTITT